jgi:hypothetical protein
MEDLVKVIIGERLCFWWGLKNISGVYSNKAFEFAQLVSLASRDAQKASLFGAPQLKR